MGCTTSIENRVLSLRPLSFRRKAVRGQRALQKRVEILSMKSCMCSQSNSRRMKGSTLGDIDVHSLPSNETTWGRERSDHEEPKHFQKKIKNSTCLMWQGLVRRYNIVVKLRVKETAIVAAICVEHLDVSPLTNLYFTKNGLAQTFFAYQLLQY